MPRPPQDIDIFDKVNYIIDMWSRPCFAPWYIYAEVLKPAALEAFITLIFFGWDDVARGYFRPKGLGRRTGKGRGKGRRPFTRFPEIGDSLGRHLPGSSAAKRANWSTGLKFLWRIDAASEAIRFGILLADVTVDLAYNFTSVMYLNRWCQASAQGSFSWQTDGDLHAAGGVWWIASISIEDYQFPEPSWNTRKGQCGQFGATIGFALNFKQWPGQPAWDSIVTELVEPTTFEVLGRSGPHDADADGKATAIVSADLGPFGKFTIRMKSTGGPFIYHDGAITGMGN